MLKSLPEVKEDGNSFLFDSGFEVTVYMGRNGGEFAVRQLTRVTLENEFAVLETQKGQRAVVFLDEVRGLVAEPSSDDRKGRKAGFA